MSHKKRDELIRILDLYDDYIRDCVSGDLDLRSFLALYDNFYAAYTLDGHESVSDELDLFSELEDRIDPHKCIWETIITKTLTEEEALARLRLIAACLKPGRRS